MGEKNKEKKKSLREHLRSKKVVVPIITIFAFALLYTGSFVFLNIVYADKVFPWVKVAGVSVGGKTKEETVANIKELTQLEAVDENTAEILTRLELLVTEKEEYDNSQL